MLPQGGGFGHASGHNSHCQFSDTNWLNTDCSKAYTYIYIYRYIYISSVVSILVECKVNEFWALLMCVCVWAGWRWVGGWFAVLVWVCLFFGGDLKNGWVLLISLLSHKKKGVPFKIDTHLHCWLWRFADG